MPATRPQVSGLAPRPSVPRAAHGRAAPKITCEERPGAKVNNVNLIGAVIGDPSLSVDRDGRDVCAMQIAVQRRGPTGEPEPGVIYIDVTSYGENARLCANELTAGQRVGVAGRLERDDSLDSRGPRRSRWEVHAYHVDLIDAVHPPAA
jgi:single-stranded DNA-binding protein